MILTELDDVTLPSIVDSILTYLPKDLSNKIAVDTFEEISLIVSKTDKLTPTITEFLLTTSYYMNSKLLVEKLLKKISFLVDENGNLISESKSFLECRLLFISAIFL